MNGTLTIEGPLDVLASIANELNERYPSTIASTVTPATAAAGWTVETARILFTGLAPKQREALRLVVSRDGFADGQTLRAAFANDNGQIRGLTGPISKRVKKLIAEGVLAPGAEPPTTTQYDADNPSLQRAGGIRMRSELVPIFRQAIEMSSAGPTR